MESPLWIRSSRGRLLRGWQKRYFILTDAGLLKEFALQLDVGASNGRSYSHGHNHVKNPSSSGMTLVQEIVLTSEMAIKALPFPLVGRQYAFQLVHRESSMRVCLSAASAELMQQWIRALRCLVELSAVASEGKRQRSAAVASSRRRAATTVMRSPPSMYSIRTSLSADDDDLADVELETQRDLVKFREAQTWVQQRVKTQRDVTLAEVFIPRGSILLAANGMSLQTLPMQDIRHLLELQRLPLTLRFLKSPNRKGLLKCQLCSTLATQVNTLAQDRNGQLQWTKQLVEIDGDVLVCGPIAAATSSSIAGGGIDASRANRTKKLISLSDKCTVKVLHEIVADQKFCFLVSVRSYSMLFKAKNREELQDWTSAIQRAIHIAEGNLPGLDLPSVDSFRLQSSINMRSMQAVLDLGATETDLLGSSEDDGFKLSLPPSKRVLPPPIPVLPSPATWSQAVDHAAYLPEDELSDMLVFLQQGGRFIEALQLMMTNTTLRTAYWSKLFSWALEPTADDDAFQQLLQIPLVEIDDIQVQKDIPRTAKWLSGSAGAPRLEAEASRKRLLSLERVLHAFLSSCQSDIRTDASQRQSDIDRANAGAPPRGDHSKSFYMQGMNGIAFILLDVLQENELLVFQFMRGLVSRVLPHVFGVIREGGNREQDHFDLFGSLAEVGQTLEEIVSIHLPQLHATMERAGLPVCLLAYKWFPTLFSDISLTAYHSQLRFETLLALWDVCLLLGVDGIFCGSLALLSSAEAQVVALGIDASAEQVSATLVRVLSALQPEDVTTSVCEVLELCSHPVLLKMRNDHRRRLQLGSAANAKSTESNSSATTAPSSTSSSASSSTGSHAMTITDLDSGRVFAISRGMLVPVAPRNS